MQDNATQTTPVLISKKEIAEKELVTLKNELTRHQINERIFQRQVFVFSEKGNFKSQLATTQENIKILSNSIEVLETIISEEFNKA